MSIAGAVSGALSSMGWMLNEICGPVLADRAYVENNLVGRNVGVTLPEVTPQTIDMEAMGTLTLPMWHLLEDMETKITKVGVDLGLGKMLGGKKLQLEIRWAQEAVDQNGNLREFGCKAFITGIPKSLPGIELKPGEASENEITYATLRYQLYIDEEEVICIDRLAMKCMIAGVDYAKSIEQYL